MELGYIPGTGLITGTIVGDTGEGVDVEAFVSVAVPVEGSVCDEIMAGTDVSVATNTAVSVVAVVVPPKRD